MGSELIRGPCSWWHTCAESGKGQLHSHFPSWALVRMQTEKGTAIDKSSRMQVEKSVDLCQKLMIYTPTPRDCTKVFK